MEPPSKPQVAINMPPRLWSKMVTHKVQTSLTRLVDFGPEGPAPTTDPGELAGQADHTRILITSWGAHPLTPDLLARFPMLDLVIHAAGSVKDILHHEGDNPAFRICTGVEINARPVAEYTLGIILCALRDTYAWRGIFDREGPEIWWQCRESYNGGYQGKTICLVGFGAVVKCLVDLLNRFSFRVLVVSEQLSEADCRRYNVRRVSLEEGARQADVLSIHEADIPQFRHLINDGILNLLRDQAWVINTARGGLIDEKALISHLRQGRLWAHLDVAESEPPPLGHPFYTLPNCILTPHIAGSVSRELERFGDYIYREIGNYLTDQPYESELVLSTIPHRA